MTESSLSLAAHYALACVANPALADLRVRQACDLVGRWSRLMDAVGTVPEWDRLMEELWMAGYLPHLFRLSSEPPQFRMLCPMAAYLLGLPWPLEGPVLPFTLLPISPARDWLLSQAKAPPSQSVRIALIGGIDLVCLPLTGGDWGGGVFGKR